MERKALLTIVPLSIWLGAALLAAFFVAPAAFASFATRVEAGTFVGRILTPVFAAGIVAAGLALVESWGRKRAWLSGAILVLAIASLGIRWKLAVLRDLPDGDPARALFGPLHGVSVAVLFAWMLAALAAIAWASFKDLSGR